MGLTPGAKQSSIVNILTTSTPIGPVKQCLGADYILICIHDGAGTGPFIINATGSIDGTVSLVTGSQAVVIEPTGGAPTGAGIAKIIRCENASAQPIKIPYPFIILTAQYGTTPGNTSFDIWPMFENQHPNIPLGLPLP